MSTSRRAIWDERHRGATPGDPEPSVIEMLPLMPHGLALDVAAGSGRNALPLARTGIKVVTADFSETGMRAISELACREQLSIAPVVADLEETFPFRPESFDVILNVTFLHRELVPKLKSALRRGGILLFDTFLIDQAASGHPRDPRFLLKHYELRELLADMELLRYREGIVTYPGDKHSWRAVALVRRRD